MAESLADFPARSQDLDAGWLTAALHHCEVLPETAQVFEFSCERLGGFASTTYRIQLVYEPVQETAPPSLVAKFGLPESEIGDLLEIGFRNEVNFYNRLAPRAGIPVPRCYFAAWDPGRRCGLVLLEEITGLRTLYPDLEALPDADHRLDALFTSRQLALMHAAWWEHPELDDPVFQGIYDADTDHRSILANVWDEFVEKAGDSLPPGLLALETPLGTAMPGIIAYLASPPRTLRHNDFHGGNILVKDGPTGPDRLVVYDWQAFTTGRGVRDLAYFSSLGTYKELRVQIQGEMLEEYHRTLVGNGVQGYSLEQCWRDYRISILDVLYFCITVITKLDLFGDEEGRDLYCWIIANVSSAVLENHSEELLADFQG